MTAPKIPSHEGHALESLVTLEPLWESRRGYITGTDGAGRPVVDFEGSPVGPRVARKAVPLDAEALQAAVRSRREVELRFEDGDARHPIIVAMAPERPPEAAPQSPRPAPAEASDAAARIIQGKDGLILRCGEASLTLLRNGKVAVKGTSVETSAEGTHRIKGASVQLNPPTEQEARPDSVPESPQLASADLQVIQGKESLVLQCGRASITLLRSGRISIKGTYVETCAEGINHIMGGSVQIN